MKSFCITFKIDPWWDHSLLKKRFRVLNLKKQKDFAAYLSEFYLLLRKNIPKFRRMIYQQDLKKPERRRAKSFLFLCNLLITQTKQKLQGERHIKNRIVSLDEPESRPIKKGKTHPFCEFGCTNQISFNRQGFMITQELFIGSPSDKVVYSVILESYMDRMSKFPKGLITDLNYRSRKNIKQTAEEFKVKYGFFGRSSDVPKKLQKHYQKARSATEGFIAIAKTHRGFRRSLYRGFQGNKIWINLCQVAYNLKKFLLLYYAEVILEKSLIKLGLIT